jgi:hypothetical protein
MFQWVNALGIAKKWPRPTQETESVGGLFPPFHTLSLWNSLNGLCATSDHRFLDRLQTLKHF